MLKREEGQEAYRIPLLEYLEPRILLDAALEGQGEVDSELEAMAMDMFDASPALFVENQGQWQDESIQYAFQGSGANVLFTDSGPVFQLYQSEANEEDAQPEDDPFALPNEGLVPEDVVTRYTDFSV
ncbi:MAG: hypothetical protein QF662_08745, partial [Phycisphaerae bacterium]|nr:hypothetical protein [Phycisphaerae bacterium]